jgi:hypothetical protein
LHIFIGLGRGRRGRRLRLAEREEVLEGAVVEAGYARFVAGEGG